jgi:hypothetical protein
VEKLEVWVEVQVELKVEGKQEVGLLWEISSWVLELELEENQVLKLEVETMILVPTTQRLESQARSSFPKKC